MAVVVQILSPGRDQKKDRKVPNYKKILIKCQEDCYWNMDDEKEQFNSNCARKDVFISDIGCSNFITKKEAEKRLKLASEGQHKE